jgi:hypothetical protein
MRFHLSIVYTFTDLVISDSYISIVGSVLEYYHFNFSIAVNVKL